MIPSSGVLVIDKPRSVTSHDVVQAVRRRLRTREVGHAGTLDPMATGVLVVAVGQATKLVPYLTAEDKIYEATVTLGAETESLDADSPVSARAPVAHDWLDRLDAALAVEHARTLQVPPAISAIHVDGERSYARARRGEVVSLPARTVAVRRVTLREVTREPPTVAIELEVAKGYYVRSFARDLARTLGTLGHLTALRRTRSGGFSVEFAEPASTAALIPLGDAARLVLPAALLDTVGAQHARAGRPIPLESFVETPPRGVPAAFFEAAALVAIGIVGDDGRGRVLRGFRA